MAKDGISIKDPKLENLTIKVYNDIKKMMFNYEIVPGQRLVFNDLANQLNVSRTPVNNALSLLSNQGFLDFTKNQGYRVHRLTKQEAESLYEIKEIIELSNIGKAIRLLNDEKLDYLKKKKELYEDAVRDHISRGRFTLDQEFHACIVEISENLYLADYFREVYQRIFLRHRIEGLLPERAQEVVKEHNEIYTAISHRDVEYTKTLIYEHAKRGREYILSIIFKDESS